MNFKIYLLLFVLLLLLLKDDDKEKNGDDCEWEIHMKYAEITPLFGSIKKYRVFAQLQFSLAYPCVLEKKGKIVFCEFFFFPCLIIRDKQEAVVPHTRKVHMKLMHCQSYSSYTTGQHNNNTSNHCIHNIICFCDFFGSRQHIRSN